MSDNTNTFKEAEEKRIPIICLICGFLATLAWWNRGSVYWITSLSLLSIYLLSGDRYQWVYIYKRTFYRDMLGLYVLTLTKFHLWMWERRNTTVVDRWNEIIKKYPDKKAFVMADKHLTFRQGDQLSNRVARYFSSRGFRRGDVIGLMMETKPEYTFVWLGLAKCGLVTSLINTGLKGTQLVHCLKVANCKAIIYDDEFVDAMKEIREEISNISLFQYSSEKSSANLLSNANSLSEELERLSSEPVDVVKTNVKDILLYIYTSGTTGLPKAAIITNIRYLYVPYGTYIAAFLNHEDVIYDPLPLHHTAGCLIGAGQAIVMGCTVVLRKKFSASNYWNDVVEYRCTAAQYIGEICRYLLAVPPGPNDKSHKVKVMLGNGLRPQIWAEFVERFKIPRVMEFYGATEGISNLINLDSKEGAVGFLCRFIAVLPLTLVKCDEVTGEILRNENGLCIQCKPLEPGLFLGKINPKKTFQTFAGYADKMASEQKVIKNVIQNGDCFFNSGDILVMDHFGYFYFKDRTGDTFRWRGENVSTSEVEAVISNLVGLNDAIVYGVQVPNTEGKAGMAAIVDPQNKLDLTSLTKGLKSALPVYSRPLFLRILSEPPLTSTFKLIKKELMKQGFDPSLHRDRIYFMDPKLGEYVILTHKLYEDIVQGKIRI